MKELLRRSHAWKRYNRNCERDEVSASELQNLSDLKISYRTWCHDPIILPKEIVLNEKQLDQEEKRLTKYIISRQEVDQLRKYIKLLGKPNQMTPEWRSYGRKHIDKITVLQRNLNIGVEN